MDLRDTVDRLGRFPASRVWFYEAGEPRSRSYSELQRDVRCAVDRLRGFGVETGMRVGLLASNCYEWVVYDLALLAMRCPSVAFPPELAQERVEGLSDRYGLCLLLIRKQDGWIEADAAPWVASMDRLEPVERRVRKGATVFDDPGFAEPSLIFSSGSTGKLKCMTVNRSGVEQMMERFIGGFGASSGDSILIFLPLSNYQQRVMAYGALDYGVDVQIADPSRVFDALRQLRPTWFVAPPLFYESIEARVRAQPRWRRGLLAGAELVLRGLPHGRTRDRLTRRLYAPVHEALGGRMRVMLTGMAPIRRSTLDLFERMRLPLYETYGLTECGPISCNFPGATRVGSVGRALGDGEVRLAEDGEVIVEREHPLTRCYYEADADDGASTYVAPNTIATGDIGRFDEDGYLFVVGRKKEIIVTPGGFKVHPETLEARLAECPLVVRAVVFGGSDLPTLSALVALPEESGDEEEETVRRFTAELNDELPGPSRIGKLAFTTTRFTAENGLLTRNLKIDRREVLRRFAVDLKDSGRPAYARASMAGDAVPENEIEAALASIWTDVLGVERIGALDNFFHLGGESILALQVVQRAHEAGIDITPSQIVSRPTIRELAAAAGQAEPLRAEQGLVSGDVPLAPVQRYLIEHAGPEVGSFATTLLLRSKVPLLAALLERAVEQVLRHHDALRLQLIREDGSWRQTHRAPEELPVPVGRVDWTDVGEGDEQARLDETVRRAQASLDPSQGRSLRVDVLDRGPGRPTGLLVTAGFLVIDGVSWPILIEDLERGYQQISEGGAIQLPPKSTAYRDWVERQVELANSDLVLEQCAYWTGLAWSELRRLPADSPAPLSDASRPRSISVSLTEQETHALLDTAKAQRVPVAELVLATAAWTLRQWTRADALGITLRAHGREREGDVDVSRTVGTFVSIFPSIFDLTRVGSPDDAVVAIHEQLARVPGGGRGFGLLRYLSTDARAERVRALPPLQIGFNFRGRFPSHYEDFELVTTPQGPAVWEVVPQPHVLDLSGSLIADRLGMTWEYREDRLSRETVEGLAERFLDGMRALGRGEAN